MVCVMILTLFTGNISGAHALTAETIVYNNNIIYINKYNNLVNIKNIINIDINNNKNQEELNSEENENKIIQENINENKSVKNTILDEIPNIVLVPGIKDLTTEPNKVSIVRNIGLRLNDVLTYPSSILSNL